ncbi:MAG: C4-type zinc ribbon domain-containing protein [Cellulomonadaceae bacterium]|nr:C4-type zinc ribbon domain-containing protein [Cellulomonadaceae bacterium]
MPTASPLDQLTLLDIHELDTRFATLVHAKRSHETHAQLQSLDAQISALDARMLASRTGLADTRRELKRAEQDVEQVLTRLTKDRELLDSGKLGHKDAMSVTEEIASLTRRQDVVEQVQLEVMERVEGTEAALTQLDAMHADLVQQRGDVQGEQVQAFADLKAQAVEVAGERKRLAAQVDPQLLKLYEATKQRLGSGAAALRAGRCTGCGLELNPGDLDAARTAPADAILRCEECGRILVRDFTDDSDAD